MTSFTNKLQAYERRCGFDRREGKMSVLTKYWLTGRREVVRRQEDRQESYHIDRHSFKTLTAVLLIISLSILDATFTLFLISHGASEINPVMAYFLGHGPLVFFGMKHLFTCTSLILILINTNSYLFGTNVRAKRLFVLLLVAFALVVNWELYLIFFVI